MRVAICIGLFVALVGCKDKDKDAGKAAPKDAPEAPEAPPPVTGLDAIPADAQAVVGLSVPKLAESELVRRGLSALLAGDPGLDARVRALVSACSIEPAEDLATVLVATGATPAQAIMVVTGTLDETQLAGCVGDTVRAGGGSLDQVTVAGRPAFASKPARGPTVWFGFGAPDTVVASTDRAWLEAALGEGAKLGGNAELMAIVERADRSGALWAAGRVRPEVGAGLVKLADGAISGPPSFMFGYLHVDNGLQAELATVMPSAADAAAIAELARGQLKTYEVIAQGAGFGATMSSLRVEVRSDTVFLRLTLSPDELNHLTSQIDRALASE